MTRGLDSALRARSWRLKAPYLGPSDLYLPLHLAEGYFLLRRPISPSFLTPTLINEVITLWTIAFQHHPHAWKTQSPHLESRRVREREGHVTNAASQDLDVTANVPGEAQVTASAVAVALQCQTDILPVVDASSMVTPVGISAI